MIQFPSRQIRLLLRTAGFTAALFLVGLPRLGLFAAESALEQQIARHLAAGEFGPAQALAAQETERGEQDRLYTRIAVAQASAGAKPGAFATVDHIHDDRARSRAYDEIARQGLATGGARGGATIQDFQPLIDLIQSTIAPSTWADTQGGPGTAEPFLGGVLVDPRGLMKRISVPAGESLNALRAQASLVHNQTSARRPSALRKISLPRLEEHLQRLRAEGRGPDEAARCLAGIYRLRYLLVYPDTGDIVLAGPAGPWEFTSEGRIVNVDTGAPVLQLDDLLVLVRNARGDQAGQFGCSITPTRDGLTAVKSYAEEAAQKPLKPNQREAWLQTLRERLGRQEIKVFGIDPRTRVARVIVEADYHMKLVGLGLAEGTLGVTNYLEALSANQDGALPSMDVLRWWFTLNYDAVQTNRERNAFELLGSGVKVLSENEMLSERGERIHTGKSQDLNAQFARSFTKHFDTLSVKYPVYAELRNVFDLAVFTSLVAAEDLPAKVDWRLPLFDNPDQLPVAEGTAPQWVDSVINYRVVNRRQVVAAISGGVSVDPRTLVKRDSVRVSDYGKMEANQAAAAPPDLPRGAWWWD